MGEIRPAIWRHRPPGIRVCTGIVRMVSGHKENVPDAAPVYSPFVGQSFPDRVYWGDTHLHTSYSWDAGLVGNRLVPDEAYRFAKGQEVISSSGQPAKLVRPLDWLLGAP